MDIKINIDELNKIIGATGISLLEYYDNNGKDEISYGELFNYSIKKFWEYISEE